MPGITARDTLDTQPDALNRTMSGQGFACVMRTTGSKTACRRAQRADEILVATDNFNQDSAHLIATRLKSLLKPFLHAVLSECSALRAITTRSIPHRLISWVRKSSLISRLTRFLSTDFGMYLLATTMPSLEFFV